MKQSQACDALPQNPLPFHSHILRFYLESIFPLPHSEVTPSEILHLLSLALSLWVSLPMMDELHILGCLSLSIMPCDQELKIANVSQQPTPFFSNSPRPHALPQPRLSPNHTCHTITITKSFTAILNTTSPCSLTHYPQLRSTKHLHSSKWGEKNIIYFVLPR